MSESLQENWLVLNDVNAVPWRVGPLSTMKRANKSIPIVGRDQELFDFKMAVSEAVRRELIQATGSDSHIFGTKTKLTVFVWRRMEEYLSHQSRRARNQEADATNMLKAIEDALHEIFYANDKDNSDVRCVVVAQALNVRPRIVIHIEEFIAFDPNELPKTVWDRLDAL